MKLRKASAFLYKSDFKSNIIQNMVSLNQMLILGIRKPNFGYSITCLQKDGYSHCARIRRIGCTFCDSGVPQPAQQQFFAYDLTSARPKNISAIGKEKDKKNYFEKNFSLPCKNSSLFRNKRFVLDEKFQQNASKFAILLEYENPCSSYRSFRATLFFL